MWLVLMINGLGIFVTPYLLEELFEGNSAADRLGRVHISPLTMLWKLCTTVICPLLFGKTIRDLLPKVRPFTESKRAALGLMQQSCLIVVSWMSLSEHSHVIHQIEVEQILLVVATSLLIHGVN